MSQPLYQTNYSSLLFFLRFDVKHSVHSFYRSIAPFTDIPQKLLLSSLQRTFIVTDECKIQSKLAVKSVLKRLHKWEKYRP